MFTRPARHYQRGHTMNDAEWKQACSSALSPEGGGANIFYLKGNFSSGDLLPGPPSVLTSSKTHLSFSEILTNLDCLARVWGEWGGARNRWKCELGVGLPKEAERRGSGLPHSCHAHPLPVETFLPSFRRAVITPLNIRQTVESNLCCFGASTLSCDPRGCVILMTVAPPLGFLLPA